MAPAIAILTIFPCLFSKLRVGACFLCSRRLKDSILMKKQCSSIKLTTHLYSKLNDLGE